MTKNIRPSHIISIFSLILMLLIGQSSGYNYVWCFGLNGHTALEQAHGSCGGEEQVLHEALHSESSELALDHCGSCLDLSLSNSYASSRLRDDHLSFSPVFFVAPVTLPLVAAEAEFAQPRFTLSDVVPRISSQILHHRTVVLLT
jgi:hypothetical protein